MATAEHVSGDEPPLVSLPATAYAVLGLLSFGRELSGYDIKKWADASLRHFYWAPAMSHIYRELQRLEQLGFVEGNEAPQDGLRNKRMYRITPSGREAVTTWLVESPAEAPMLKHPAALRVWLGHLVEPDDLSRLLSAHVDRLRDELADIDASINGVRDDDAMRYPAAVLQWAKSIYEADLAASQTLQQSMQRAADATRPTR
jgi:DNA-binding PadR family transcriptional regulator